eukprot:scaffold80012_cov33-Tisochrysis_lutea.AAC.2
MDTDLLTVGSVVEPPDDLGSAPTDCHLFSAEAWLAGSFSAHTTCSDVSGRFCTATLARDGGRVCGGERAVLLLCGGSAGAGVAAGGSACEDDSWAGFWRPHGGLPLGTFLLPLEGESMTQKAA